jgi:hypothetical protein
MESYANQAIQSVLHSQKAYCKFLSANDAGATGSNQFGILVSKSVSDMLFNEPLGSSNIMKRSARINWQNDFFTDSNFTYYDSKKELRITKFGRGFPLLQPENTGSLFVLTKQDTDHYSAFILDSEDDIEYFMDAFSMSPTETNREISAGRVTPGAVEVMAAYEYINSLTVDFPSSYDMSAAAQEIQNRAYNHLEYIRTNPDRKIIEWTDTEYFLFRLLEEKRYRPFLIQGFGTVDSFLSLAQVALNRRKSRAGKSLEHHLSAIFDGNNLLYTAQAITEGKKKPDFIFPSQDAYHDLSFPTERLISLASKTTCKDRWRQVINEADRLRDQPKYLFTLQQGISPAQMDEMQAENVILVVPKDYIGSYPANRQDRIWTLSRFVGYVREKEGL